MTHSPDETIHSFCNRCQQSTRHEVVGSCSRELLEGNEQFPRIVDEQWNMLQCCGCESIKVLVREESTDFKTPRETHYPPRQARQMPKRLEEMPQQCQDILCEVYKAMNINCVTLSAMGTRTLLDVMLREMLGDIGGFKQKLDKAQSKGIFTEQEKERISAAIDAGNAASHRGFTPTQGQMDDVLDIVEHTLIGQYVLAASSGRLRSEVPSRESQGG